MVKPTLVSIVALDGRDDDALLALASGAAPGLESRLATAILDEEKGEERVEDRGPQYDEQQHDGASRRPINIGPVFLSGPAEVLAPPIESQGTQERCRVCATVK